MCWLAAKTVCWAVAIGSHSSYMSVGFPELILLCRWEVGVTSCVMTMTRWRSGSFFGVFSAGLLFTPPKLAIRIGVFCSLARVTGCLAWAGMCLRACKGSVPVLGRLWGKSESPAQRSVCVMTMTSTLNLGSFLLSAVCVECAWVARSVTLFGFRFGFFYKRSHFILL